MNPRVQFNSISSVRANTQTHTRTHTDNTKRFWHHHQSQPPYSVLPSLWLEHWDASKRPRTSLKACEVHYISIFKAINNFSSTFLTYMVIKAVWLLQARLSEWAVWGIIVKIWQPSSNRILSPHSLPPSSLFRAAVCVCVCVRIRVCVRACACVCEAQSEQIT